MHKMPERNAPAFFVAEVSYSLLTTYCFFFNGLADMITKPAIFVSSTSKMVAERTELRSKLPSIYELYLYEWDRAARGSPEERVRAMLTQSDVFLGVLGPDYGSLYPGEKRSIVEWEFDTARELGKLEIFTFVKKPGDGEIRDPAQEAFLSRIGGFRSGMWMHAFATPAELVEAARESLEGWLAEVYRQTREANRPLARKVWTISIVLSVLALLAFGGVIVLRYSTLSNSALLALCVCIFVLVALCLIAALCVDTGGPDGKRT